MKKNNLQDILEEIVLEILDEMGSMTGSMVNIDSYDGELDLLSTQDSDEELDEAVKMSLDKYKKEVRKYLKDKSVMNDQFFYEEMIDAFTKGIPPKSFVLTNEEKIEELNSTATTGDMSYNTPNAFKKTKGDEDEEKSGFNDGHEDPEVFDYKKAKVTRRNFKESEFKRMAKEMLLSEVTYRQYKYDKTATPHQKVNKSIHNINSQLIKIERIINQNIKLKKESGVDNQQYWKSTRNKFQKVNERLMRISGKLRELWR